MSLAIVLQVEFDRTIMRPSIPIEPTAPRVSNGSGALSRRNPDESRTWPRCEPALTHFELGASSEHRPITVMAKRYTPRYGVRKE